MGAVTKKALRPIRIEGDVAYVSLTRGYEAVIDATDVPLVAAWHWCAQVNRRAVYAQRKGENRSVLMHAVILQPRDGLLTDHIDGDGLNNRRSNLRYATASQNSYNRQFLMPNKHGLMGVSWDCQRGKWYSQIRFNGKTRSLGRYNTPEEANAAYLSARATLHGEFVRSS